MKAFELGKYFHSKGFKLPTRLVERYIRIAWGMSIKFETKIGKGIVFGYGGLGVVIHPKVVIGDNVTVAQGVTLGGKHGCKQLPTIGNNVYIGCGAKVLGDVHVGDNVIIGANSVVVKSIPDNVVVAGVPAKIIRDV